MSLFSDDISVDQDLSDYETEYEDRADSSFTLASNLYDFSYEHGRRYPSYRYGSHPFPQDDLTAKNNRILHHMFLYILDNRLFLSPVKDPQNILDVKSSEGLWTENVADAFPDANIVGMDTTPMTRSTIPNISYVVQSFTDEWILDQPDMKFDFIYGRSLFAYSKDFAPFYQQVFENLVPGGYFEHAEIEIIPRSDDGSKDPNGYIQKFADSTPSMSSTFGTDYNIATQMKDLIIQAGFVDLKEVRIKLPLGPWSADPKYKQIGEWFEAFYKSGLQGWVLAPMTRGMGFSPEHVNDMIERCFKEVDSRKQHVYFTAVIIYCQKPE